MKCLIWNIEWATQSSLKVKRIKKLIENADPDVVCFSEATLGMIPENGYVIESDPTMATRTTAIEGKCFFGASSLGRQWIQWAATLCPAAVL